MAAGHERGEGGRRIVEAANETSLLAKVIMMEIRDGAVQPPARPEQLNQPQRDQLILVLGQKHHHHAVPLTHMVKKLTTLSTLTAIIMMTLHTAIDTRKCLKLIWS